MTGIPVPQRFVRSCALLGALGAVAYAVFGVVPTLQPFTPDNLRIIAWADGSPVSAALRADPATYPEWRPLTYVLVWLQYQWLGLAHLSVPFELNVFAWVICAWLVGEIVRGVTASDVAAFASAVATLTRMRAVTSMMVIEPANLLACLFGLLAVLLVVNAPGGSFSRARSTGLVLLLLASALSKEYGLAFAIGLLLWWLMERRRAVSVAALVGLLAYAALRLLFAHGAVAPVCVDQGYFFGVRTMCTDWTQIQTWQQATYNVAATAVNVLTAGFINNFGDIGIDPARVITSAPLLAITATGYATGPREMRLALLIASADAVLNFLLYRPRNQLIAMCALGIPLGAGVGFIHDRLRRSQWPRLLPMAMAMALTLVLTRQAVATHNLVNAEIADAADYDPCDALMDERPLDPAFVRRVKAAFEMPNPDCLFTHDLSPTAP